MHPLAAANIILRDAWIAQDPPSLRREVKIKQNGSDEYHTTPPMRRPTERRLGEGCAPRRRRLQRLIVYRLTSDLQTV